MLTQTIIFFGTGIYKDTANGIMDGAPGPIIIHTDKSKTKDKEKEERERQRNGENPRPQTVAPRFKAGFENSPDIKVQTTCTGSMTQEIFYEFAVHFVDNLPKNDNRPKILLLDGHAS